MHSVAGNLRQHHCLVLNSESRKDEPGVAHQKVFDFAAALMRAGYLPFYKKLDSTLKGPWCAELAGYGKSGKARDRCGCAGVSCVGTNNGPGSSVRPRTARWGVKVSCPSPHRHVTGDGTRKSDSGAPRSIWKARSSFSARRAQEGRSSTCEGDGHGQIRGISVPGIRRGARRRSQNDCSRRMPFGNAEFCGLGLED